MEQERRARHHAHWPPGLPRHLTLPQTSLWYNVEVSATRYPDKSCLIYYDTPLSYAQLREECERVAGWLQQDCGVQAGDRVLLYMQNSPQWVIAYYGILRANAVVVPVNPMNRTEELRHYVEDSDARVAIVGQDVLRHVEPILKNALVVKKGMVEIPDRPGLGMEWDEKAVARFAL